ncbi:TRAP transporter large permease [Acetomicrobium sp. S15 = DSM 107314]|jgi:tripartite ATP-independent transporter DctM subunit|uniref:TRAP transporter large permease n=1 Tax=Acetomicrobium sp. S15 = DSM 107314 TaxID=2529858 RepID=UPI0018E0F053|nr:TRAP transporter large permease [Acetomicrobium sp. S15 = DSM 107314]
MLLVVCAFLVFLLMGMPVAFAIGIGGVLFFLQHPELPITIPIQLAITQTQNFPLLAIPMFVLAGNLMNGAGITRRLLDLAEVLTGHMRAGLVQVSVVLSVLMGGVSGSCIADAAMEARMLGPDMIRRGYQKGFAAAAITWTSLIVPTIPPSIGLILYGSIGQVSIGRLFAGGIVPGLLMMMCYMVAVSIYARKKGYLPERSSRAPLREVATSVWKNLLALIFPVILLVGLRFGLFTPSEVGSFAVFYALFVGLVAYKELSWESFKIVLRDSIIDIGAVMFLIAISGIFSYGIVWERIPELIANYLLSISDNSTILLFIIMVFLIIAGMFVDATVLILMLTCIFLPIATHVGLDPVHFGLFFVITITIGNITPPVGAAMYAVCTILDCSIQDFVKGSLPFFLAALVVIALLVLLPDVFLFVPNLLFGGK